MGIRLSRSRTRGHLGLTRLSSPPDQFTREIDGRLDSIHRFPNDVVPMPVVGKVLAGQFAEAHVGLRPLGIDSLTKLKQEVPADNPPAQLAAGRPTGLWQRG